MRALGTAVMAAVLMTTGAASAQTVMRVGPAGVVLASDFDAPYEDVGPPAYQPPRYAPRPYPQAYPAPPTYAPSGYAAELPVYEIMRIVRQGGYSPLSAPHYRGNVYTIAVIDADGEDGRLVIDAYSGRIIRFVPADRFGARSVPAVPVAYGPYMGPAVRPPMAVPQARASVPVPKPRVAAVQPLPDRTSSIAPRQPDALAKIPPAPTAALAAAPPVAAPATIPAIKPQVVLQPTQAMPPAQGVE